MDLHASLCYCQFRHCFPCSTGTIGGLGRIQHLIHFDLKHLLHDDASTLTITLDFLPLAPSLSVMSHNPIPHSATSQTLMVTR